MFIFNGIDFSEHVKVTDIQRPLMAPQRISSTNIEGKAEEIFHRKVSSSYNIDVELFVIAQTRIGLQTKYRELAGMLDTTGLARLTFKDEPDKYVMVTVEDTSFPELFENRRMAKVSVSFKVLDPYWYAEVDDMFEYTATGSKAITRKGNAESFPIIEIEGTSSSGYYIVGANGSQMRYNGSLIAGEKLIFNSALLTAYILEANGNKKSVLNKLVTLDFPTLTKGNNTFTLAMGDGATLTNCKLICNSRWK